MTRKRCILRYFAGNLSKLGRDYSGLEFQGYAFGGLILVPPQDLKILFEKNIHNTLPLVEQAKAQGLERSEYLRYVKDNMATILAPYFEVSTQVIIKRIEFDKLDDLIP